MAGIEADPELVRAARKHLGREGVVGKVTRGDIFKVPIHADVLLTYLTPATLQRLAPRLQALDARLVTIDFAVPGLQHDAIDDTLTLYRLPAAEQKAATDVGWPEAGLVVVAPADRQSLTCLEMRHPGGGVRGRLVGDVRHHVAMAFGADSAEPGQRVAVDLVWDGSPAGTFARGVLRVPGLDPYPLYVLFADDGDGVWSLTHPAVTSLRRFCRNGNLPRDASQLLEAAEA